MPDSSQRQGDPAAPLRCIVSHNKYGEYCVPESSSHRPAAQRILANDVHEPGTIEFLLAHCGDGDIVHAGAYFGDFLPALAGGCGPRAKIWAFEPNPENFRCARITARMNCIDRIELINAGLGERNELRLMLTSDEDGQARGGASRILAHEEAGLPGGTHAVQMVTADATIPPDRTVSVMHLDVEGHEREALNGSLQTIRRCRPILVVEIWRESTLMQSDWFSRNILSLGYRMTESIHGNSVFVCGAP